MPPEIGPLGTLVGLLADVPSNREDGIVGTAVALTRTLEGGSVGTMDACIEDSEGELVGVVVYSEVMVVGAGVARTENSEGGHWMPFRLNVEI